MKRVYLACLIFHSQNAGDTRVVLNSSVVAESSEEAFATAIQDKGSLEWVQKGYSLVSYSIEETETSSFFSGDPENFIFLNEKSNTVVVSLDNAPEEVGDYLSSLLN